MQQVKLCDHLQFSHRKRANPYGHSIVTNWTVLIYTALLLSCSNLCYFLNIYAGNIDTYQYINAKPI